MQKVIDYILCQLYFFKSTFEQKFIALHLNESCLLGESCLVLLYLLGESCLLCFLGVLRYLNEACVCVFFLCVKTS